MNKSLIKKLIIVFTALTLLVYSVPEKIWSVPQVYAAAAEIMDSKGGFVDVGTENPNEAYAFKISGLDTPEEVPKEDPQDPLEEIIIDEPEDNPEGNPEIGSEEEETFTVEEITAVKYVNTSANIRGGPSTEYDIIGCAAINTELSVTGRASTGWYRVEYKGETAYISAKLVSDEKVIIEEPVQPAPEVVIPATAGRTPIETYPKPSQNEQILIDTILAGTVNPAMSDYEVAVAINNYLCAHADYDYSYSNYTAYSLFTTGRGVCQAYANAYWRLMNAAGIPTDYVRGYSSSGGRHGWNRCLINGSYYYVDVTWNDSKNCWNKYLLVSYEQISVDHIETSINPGRAY